MRTRPGGRSGGARPLLILVAALAGGCAPALRSEDTAPAAPAYARLADEVDAHLRRDVLARWFPRCVDPRGGFYQVFARDWTRRPDADRFLVYQARMTWVAAAVALWDPALAPTYRTYALHGLAYLDGTMRDREAGGLHYRLDPEGRVSPALGIEKHAYGLSFAIYAGAAAYEATHDPRALALASDTFRWLDDHAHDAAAGGWFEALARDGTPLLAPPGGVPAAFNADAGGYPADGIGTPYGYKSMNTHIHLLEALTALYRVAPDDRLRARLEEVLRIVRDRVAVEPGCLGYYFTPDWRPVPMHDSFGHDVETAYLLVEAADALGRPDDQATWRVARALVDHALAWGWDAKHGGFFYEGQAFAPAHVRYKEWWTQAEGLNALLLMHERYGRETPRYWRAFLKEWRFIRDHQADRRFGGWYARVSETGRLVGSADKASPWKAAYHTTRALMNTVARLRRLAGRARDQWQVGSTDPTSFCRRPPSRQRVGPVLVGK